MQYGEQEDGERPGHRGRDRAGNKGARGARCSPRATQPGAQGARTREKGQNRRKDSRGHSLQNLWKNLAVPQKVKIKIVTLPPSNAIPGYTLKRKTHVHTKTHRNFSAALLTIAKKSKKQPKCSSADERIYKVWFIHTIEYYSAMKRSEALTLQCG